MIPHKGMRSGKEQMVTEIRTCKTSGITDKRWKRYLLVLASSALTVLTLIFPKIGFLEWLTLIPLGIFLLDVAASDRVRLRGMFGYGMLFFTPFYIALYYWFAYLYPLEFMEGMTTWAAVAVVFAACILLPLLQALYGGLMFMGIRFLFRCKLFSKYTFLRPLAVAGTWALMEWTQTIGWWGVPWGRLPVGQTEYLAGLQTASVLGSYFVTFLLVAVNMCVAYAILNVSARKIMTVCVLSSLLVQYGVGMALYFTPVDNEETVKVAAIQGNIASNEKWVAESREKTLEVYKKYTLEAAENGAKIVVWPETALPYRVTANTSGGKFCSTLAQEAGVTLLVGCFTTGDNGEYYNSIVCFLPDGTLHEDTYTKRKLMPFGEFVPLKAMFEKLIPPLAELVMSDDDLTAGVGAQLIYAEGVNIGGMICYDSIYEGTARETVLEGAQLIVMPTNESWFSDSAALYIHNSQAQLRAIETGRYITRAANTGISTVISSKGKVLQMLEPYVEGYVSYDVPLNSHQTVYSMTGNLFILILAAFLGGVSVWEICRIVLAKNHKNYQG